MQKAGLRVVPCQYGYQEAAVSNIAAMFSGGVPAWIQCDGPRMYPPSFPRT